MARPDYESYIITHGSRISAGKISPPAENRINLRHKSGVRGWPTMRGDAL